MQADSITLQVTLTRKPGAFVDRHAVLRWIASALNCNTHHVEAVVAINVPEEEGGGVLSFGPPLAEGDRPIHDPYGPIPIPPRKGCAVSGQGCAQAEDSERPAEPAEPLGIGMYVNYGGMGLTLDQAGKLDGLEGNEMRSLILRDGFTQVQLAHWMPSEPWTLAAIASALGEAADLIGRHACCCAYLGEQYLGSTEI